MHRTPPWGLLSLCRSGSRGAVGDNAFLLAQGELFCCFPPSQWFPCQADLEWQHCTLAWFLLIEVFAWEISVFFDRVCNCRAELRDTFHGSLTSYRPSLNVISSLNLSYTDFSSGEIPMASKSQNSASFLSKARSSELSSMNWLWVSTRSAWMFVKFTCVEFNADPPWTGPESTLLTLVWRAVGQLSPRLTALVRKCQ